MALGAARMNRRKWFKTIAGAAVAASVPVTTNAVEKPTTVMVMGDIPDGAILESNLGESVLVRRLIDVTSFGGAARKYIVR